jgi:predicted nucleic acid-binding protein
MDRIVLDTNVLLDWLVFDEPSVRALGQAVEHGQIEWLHCPAMRVEFEHMVRHASMARWEPDVDRCLGTLIRLGRCVDAPTLGHRVALRCSDADDQVFVDLAVAHRARWLVSRDRAVLKLARRARLLGLQVLTPQGWAMDFARSACA